MRLLYNLFGQLYEVLVFSELIHDQVIFQKSVFGFFYSYSLFLAISFRVIDAWYSEFLIIGLLYYAQYYQGFFIFSILAHSQSNIKYAVQREFFYKVMLSGQYYSTSFEDLYNRKCRRCYILIIGIIPVPVPFVFILPFIEIARTQFL